jgi:hypothetical protein
MDDKMIPLILDQLPEQVRTQWEFSIASDAYSFRTTIHFRHVKENRYWKCDVWMGSYTLPSDALAYLCLGG